MNNFHSGFSFLVSVLESFLYNKKGDDDVSKGHSPA